MATTTPFPFDPATATLTPEKVASIIEWYEIAQGDEDKAGDVEDGCFYEGLKSAFKVVLHLLTDTKPEEQPQVTFTTQALRDMEL